MNSSLAPLENLNALLKKKKKKKANADEDADKLYPNG